MGILRDYLTSLSYEIQYIIKPVVKCLWIKSLKYVCLKYITYYIIQEKKNRLNFLLELDSFSSFTMSITIKNVTGYINIKKMYNIMKTFTQKTNKKEFKSKNHLSNKYFNTNLIYFLFLKNCSIDKHSYLKYRFKK